MSAQTTPSHIEDVIVVRVPFSPNFDQYARSIRYDDLDDAQTDAQELFHVAAKKLEPMFLIRQTFITSHKSLDGLPAISIDDQVFSGKALSVLKPVFRVFPYIATCGSEMEDQDLSSLDFLAPYWLDALKIQALGAARSALRTYFRDQYGVKKAQSLNPGSGNVDIWPIEQMAGIFNLLGGADHIARIAQVTLTSSSLMIPNKTIAGLFFVSAESDYESCAYCERAYCPSRRVPFKERL
jgi:hypothetical protein